MKKKFLAVLCVALIAFNFIALPVAAVAVPALIGGALVVIGAINDVFDFAQLICDTWSDFKSDLANDFEVKQIQIYAYWNEFIIQGKLTETDFRAYYTEVVNCSGNSAYYDDVPLTDGQIAVVNAYEYVLDTSANGISLDDICSYCFSDDGVAIDNPDTGFDDNGNITVSGETFSEICDRLAEQYAPDAKTEYISWAKEQNPNTIIRLGFYEYGKGLPSGTSQCYLMPFYNDGSKMWWSKYQLCVTITDGILSFSYRNITEPTITEFTAYEDCQLDIAEYPYIRLTTYPDWTPHYQYTTPFFYLFKTYADYIALENYTLSWHHFVDDIRYYYSEDLTEKIDIENSRTPFLDKPTGDEACDVGFYFSDSFIEMNGIIQPIPVEYLEDTTVTLSGDTIYDYTITNNTTGDTSTVNYYVNNNYTYENTNDSTDGDTSSGSTSGDIKVSGDIEVGGQVDININVGSSGGTSESPSSMPVDVDLNNYLEQTPEQAKPITSFFEVFFDFLPPELLALICLGVTVAILLRIWGR